MARLLRGFPTRTANKPRLYPSDNKAAYRVARNYSTGLEDNELYLRNPPAGIFPDRALNTACFEQFRQMLSAWPRCTDDFACGVYRKPREQAIKRAYIAPNPDGWIAYLIFDIDRSDGGASWIDAGLPPPNFIVMNPRGSCGRDGCTNEGRAHLIYRLRGWIRVGAGDSAERYLEAVRRAYTQALGADPGYAGHLMKNPLSDRYVVHVTRAEPYDLNALAQWVELESVPRRAQTTLDDALHSRNVRLFDDLRRWAYDTVETWWCKGDFVSWKRAVLERAEGIAETLLSAKGMLALKEIRHTAASVAKWVWNHYKGRDPKKREQRQERERRRKAEHERARSKQTREAYCAPAQQRKAEALSMRAAGLSFRRIAQALCCSPGEIVRVLNEATKVGVQGSRALSDIGAVPQPEALGVVQKEAALANQKPSSFFSFFVSCGAAAKQVAHRACEHLVARSARDGQQGRGATASIGTETDDATSYLRYQKESELFSSSDISPRRAEHVSSSSAMTHSLCATYVPSVERDVRITSPTATSPLTPTRIPSSLTMAPSERQRWAIDSAFKTVLLKGMAEDVGDACDEVVREMPEYVHALMRGPCCQKRAG